MIATSGSARFACAAACALLLATRAANAAPPTPESVATARELYRQGADALEAKDPKTAIEKLSAAWALVQTPLIGLGLARAQLAVGHLVEAREAALAVMRAPQAPDETDRSTRARSDAEALSAALEPRIPHLTLRVTNLAPDRAVTVKVDGVVVPSAALALARQTNPGRHTAVIDVDDGRHAEGSASVLEGEAKDLVLVLPAPPPPPPAPTTALGPATAPVAAPLATSPPTSKGVSSLVWAGVALTGAGLVVGAVTGGLALSEASTVKANCTLQIGSDTVCPSAFTHDLSASHTYATVSTVGFVGAGVGVGVMIAGFVLGNDKGTTTARLVPILGPMSGVAGTF